MSLLSRLKSSTESADEHSDGVISCRMVGTEACEVLAAMNRDLIRDEGLSNNPPDMPELIKRMRSRFRYGYCAVLFEMQDKPVGYAVFRVGDKQMYIRHFFIKLTFRGQGFGRRAFNLLMENYRPKGLRLVVESLRKNTAGIAFWKALGFNEYSVMLEKKE